MSRFIYNYAECHYTECHYARCSYAECRGAPAASDDVMKRFSCIEIQSNLPRA